MTAATMIHRLAASDPAAELFRQALGLEAVTSLTVIATSQTTAASSGAAGGPVRPMQVDYIALGLARWAELEIADLVSRAPALLLPSNAAGRRLLAALGAASRLEETEPPLRDLRSRRKAARQLAARFGLKPEPWMLLELWHSQIGCNVCQVNGTAAPCWGAAGCHGYYSSCGCAD